MEEDKRISERIKKSRKIARMTQQELADKIGISLITMNRWEKGERIPRADDMSRIAEALDVSAGYLMGMEEKPERRKDISVKENTTQERNTNMAVITLDGGRKVEAPATPEGYAFLERLFLASLGKQAVATA